MTTPPRLVLALLIAGLSVLTGCGDDRDRSQDPGAPARPVEPSPSPAPEVAAEPHDRPREVTLIPGRVEQLLLQGGYVPTREAVATWNVGGEALLVLTRRRDVVKEDPSERIGIAGVDVELQVIVVQGTREQVVLATTVSNMLALADHLDIAVFAALDGEGMRLSIDTAQPAGVLKPDPPETLRARVVFRDGRVEVTDRWQGELSAMPEAHSLRQDPGVPWTPRASVLSVDGDALIWWDSEWNVLHRQPAPPGARLLLVDQGVIVATPSEVWRIDRARGTALRNRVLLPSVERALPQMDFHHDRAVVTRVDRVGREVCVEVSMYEDPTGDQKVATYAIDRRGVARGWLTFTTGKEYVEPPPCRYQPAEEEETRSFDVKTCVATFLDGGPSVTTPRNGPACYGVDFTTPDGSVLAVFIPMQPVRPSPVRLALMDRASGKLIAERPEPHRWSAPAFAPKLPAALSDGWLLDARNGGLAKRLGTTAIWLDE